MSASANTVATAHERAHVADDQLLGAALVVGEPIGWPSWVSGAPAVLGTYLAHRFAR